MEISESFQEKTRKAFLWMNLSHEPFFALYALLPFILRKDLHATILQISILSSLRPVLAVFSFYWSANLTYEPHKLRANLISAWILARLPFLLVPWFDNVWYIIFCCALYELFNRSGLPALIEILKINIPQKKLEKTYTLYYVISFLESIFLGFFIGWVLQLYSSWQVLCGLTALFSLSSVFLQIQIPIPEKPIFLKGKLSWNKQLTQPWIEAFTLLKKDPHFAQFQWGFMTGGFGLMLIAPSLSIFYADYLHLSHQDVVLGRSILMGIGVVLSSYFWKKWLKKDWILPLTQWILFGFSLYALCLISSEMHIAWFYLALIIYGIAQAGSHLLWHLSGTLFAETQDSSQYSRVNILLLGIRGAIAPAFGGILCKVIGPVSTFAFGAVICFAGAMYIYFFQWKGAQVKNATHL